MIMENKDLKTVNNILDIPINKKQGTDTSTNHSIAATRHKPHYHEQRKSKKSD